MRTRTLDARTLGRATLHRQLLLTRAEQPVATAVEQLAGLQAQQANPPYLALAARLAGFTFDALTDLISDATIVRSTLMRGTLHLVTARDFGWLRPTVQPGIERMFHGAFRKRLAGADLAAVITAADSLLDEQDRSHAELKQLLGPRFPDADPAALAYAVQYLRPVVHLPPAGIWGRGGSVRWVPAHVRVGGPRDTRADPPRLIRRYLSAFGPAGVRDVQAWSGLPRLGEIVDAMRAELVVHRDESGRELFDLPECSLPDPDVPAPVRLLPEFDSLLVAHDDRTRTMSADDRARVCVGSAVAATVLVDGRIAGTWTRLRGKAGGLAVTPFRRFTAKTRSAVREEAERVLALTGSAPDADVQILAPE